MKFDRLTVVVMLACAAFQVWAADYYTVFDDEAFSLQRYVLPAGELIRALWNGAEPDPPLYYLLEHTWIQLVGVRPLPMRGLSILFFVLSLPVLRAAGEAWYDRAAGRWAVVLCGLNPLHLFFGFAARWYALFFLWTSVLLLATGKLSTAAHQPEASAARRRFLWPVIWVMAAAAACYTNYLGPVVVGVTWMYAAWTQRGDRRMLAWLLIATVALFLPWMPAFVAEIGRFPQVSSAPTSYAVCAARTLIALAAGNLAGPDSLYVWIPMGVFGLGTLMLAIAAPRRLGGPACVALGVAVAGIASLVLIDKYVMAFSGAFWLTAAGVLSLRHAGRLERARQVTVAALSLAWAGCGINWILEQDWTSLRWLDPIPQAVREHIWDPVIVATHPSVRYYYGCKDPARWTGRLPPQRWSERADMVLTPAQALERLDSVDLVDPSGRPLTVATIRTASIRSDDAGWPHFEAWLNENMKLEKETALMPDPWAGLKDRLDPVYVHPTHRVIARRYVAETPRVR